MSIKVASRKKCMPFEILTLHDTTWQIDATVTKKVEAEEVANQMLSEPGVTGVRIVLDNVLIAKSIDQLEDEDIIFEKLKEAGQEKIFITTRLRTFYRRLAEKQSIGSFGVILIKITSLRSKHFTIAKSLKELKMQTL